MNHDEKLVHVADASPDAGTRPFVVEPDLDEPFTKLTVLVTPGATAALARASEHADDSRTDTLNRALHVYCELITAEPGTTVSFVWTNGSSERRSVYVVR